MITFIRKIGVIPLEYLNAYWCAEIQDVGLFNRMQIFHACPSPYSQYHN